MVFDEVTTEFTDGEPQGDFDFEQFERDCRDMLENYDNFCEEHALEPHYDLGEPDLSADRQAKSTKGRN